MDEKTRTRLDLHRDNICSRAIYSLCFNLGAAMSRPFRVGDIVNGWCKDGEKIVLFCENQVISSIDGEYYTIDGFFFIQQYLTLVTPAESKRGVETYKDQFTKWKPGHLVTIGAETINKLSDLEIDAMSISNCAIRIMIKEQ